MRTISTNRPKATKQTKPTEDYVEAVNEILDNGFSQIEMVADLHEALHIPDSADLRLVSIRLLTERYMQTLDSDIRETAVEVAQQAMLDFDQRNPYHVEYSFVAYYGDDNGNRDCQYDGFTSPTLLSDAKVKAELKRWFKGLPTTMPSLLNKTDKLSRSWARCQSTVVDSRGTPVIGQQRTVEIY